MLSPEHNITISPTTNSKICRGGPGWKFDVNGASFYVCASSPLKENKETDVKDLSLSDLLSLWPRIKTCVEQGSVDEHTSFWFKANNDEFEHHHNMQRAGE